MILFYILFAVLILVLIPYLLNIFFLKEKLKNFNELLNFSKNKNFFLDKDNLNNTIKFIPHPYTNWTLNPNHKKNFNENPNTKEGFRKVDDDNSVFETLKKSQKKKELFVLVVQLRCVTKWQATKNLGLLY